MTVVDAIKRAGSTDKEKLIAAMEKTDYDSPMGKITFKKSEEGGLHQAIDEQIVTQWQAGVPTSSSPRPQQTDLSDSELEKPVACLTWRPRRIVRGLAFQTGWEYGRG